MVSLRYSGVNLFTLLLFDTNVGLMGITGSLKGLREIILPQKLKKEVLSYISGSYNLIREAEGIPFGDLPQRLRRYLTGEVVDFPDRLDMTEATVFQQRVWQVTRSIPYGETRSYAWVSDQLGYAKNAARAVGRALGRNPLPIIIPCHRVISADGGLGGFSAGLEMKRYLLRLESTSQLALT